MTFRTVRLGRTERDKGVRQTLSFKPRVPNLEFLVQNKSDGNVIQSLDFGRTKPLGSRGFNAAKCPCTSFLRDIPAWKGSRGFLLGGENQGADPWGSAGSSAPWGVPENPSKVVQLRWKSQLCGFGLQLLLAALLRVGAQAPPAPRTPSAKCFIGKKPLVPLWDGGRVLQMLCVAVEWGGWSLAFRSSSNPTGTNPQSPGKAPCGLFLLLFVSSRVSGGGLRQPWGAGCCSHTFLSSWEDAVKARVGKLGMEKTQESCPVLVSHGKGSMDCTCT